MTIGRIIFRHRATKHASGLNYFKKNVTKHINILIKKYFKKKYFLKIFKL